VALKKMDTSSLDAEEAQGVWREIEFLQNIDHQNVIGYYDHWQDGADIWLAMEIAPGGDLDGKFKDAMKTGTLIKEDLLGTWAAGTVYALGYLHENNVVHRDIKLANLMLDGYGQIKLCDFGMAAELKPGEWLEEYGKGPPLYQSPELCARRPYNEKVDVWAMGCVLYELAARNRPFDGKNMITIAKKIQAEKPKALSSAYSASCRKFVMGLLEKDIAKRPSMEALVQSDFITKHANKQSTPQLEASDPPPSTVMEDVGVSPSGGDGSERSKGVNKFLDTVQRRKNSSRDSGGSTVAGGGRREKDPKKKTTDILKRFGEMRQKVAREENAQYSEEGRSRMSTRKPERRRAAGDRGPQFSKGQTLLYTRTGEEVQVTGVHQDDPEEMYYTIKMTDGREKQTVESALALAPKPVVSKGNTMVLYPDSDDDGWENQFSPQGMPASQMPEPKTPQHTGVESLGGFDMPSEPVWEDGDYPSEWGRPEDWAEVDDVQASAISADEVRRREDEGDQLTLAQLRARGKQQLLAVRTQDQVDWVNITEAFRTPKVVRTIIKRIDPAHRPKAALVCKVWCTLVSKGQAKQRKSGNNPNPDVKDVLTNKDKEVSKCHCILS